VQTEQTDTLMRESPESENHRKDGHFFPAFPWHHCTLLNALAQRTDGIIHIRSEKRKNGQMNGRTNGRTDGRTDRDQVRSHCKLNIKCPADCRSLCHAAGQQRCRHRSALQTGARSFHFSAFSKCFSRFWGATRDN